MRIIRQQTQKTICRSEDNRQIRIIFDESVKDFDWLTITHSKQFSRKTDAGVKLHRHPNATEMIIFLKDGSLEVNSERYDFNAEDMVLLDPADIHGAHNLNEHDCICILMGKGKPQKQSHESQNNIT